MPPIFLPSADACIASGVTILLSFQHGNSRLLRVYRRCLCFFQLCSSKVHQDTVVYHSVISSLVTISFLATAGAEFDSVAIARSLVITTSLAFTSTCRFVDLRASSSISSSPHRRHPALSRCFVIPSTHSFFLVDSF